MKILTITNLYPPEVIGGYELNCKHVVDALRRRGHEVFVLTSMPNFAVSERNDGVTRTLSRHSHRPSSQRQVSHDLLLHASDMSDLNNVIQFIKALQDGDFDLVFFWNLHGLGGLHLIDAANSINIPWALYLGDRVLEQVINSGPAYVVGLFGANDPAWIARGLIMAVSQHLIDEIVRMTGLEFPSRPNIIAGYAIDSESDIRLPYIRNSTARFVFAGHISEEKGVRIICDAAVEVINSGIRNFCIDIFGGGNIDVFERYAEELHLGDHVYFRGAVTQQELLAEYGASDAFLFPTWEREPFAFAPFEAASRGCIPIITANCGPSERLVHNVNCLKVLREASSFAVAMKRIITGEVDLDSMGLAARNLVNQQMRLDHHVDAIEELLRGQIETNCFHRDASIETLAYLKHHLSIALLTGVGN